MPRQLIYLFTSFPVATETFLLRELRALRALGHTPEIHSLWGGKDVYDGFQVQRFGWRDWLKGFVGLARFTLTHPALLRDWVAPLLATAPDSVLNLWENLLGALFALSKANSWSDGGDRHLHAVWASAPAAAAELSQRLYHCTFSFGAHAYDLFEYGGDALLPRKAQSASFVVTSSIQGRDALLLKGVQEGQILLLRRGLMPMPELNPMPLNRSHLQILTVGRLVEKMGYHQMLQAFAQVRHHGIQCHLTIIGSGPLEREIRTGIQRLGLNDFVTLTGALPFESVCTFYQRCHVFLFTGVIARSGDRAGFPNAIGEAMAFGLPAICAPVGAVPEVIRHGVNGFIFAPRQLPALLSQLQTEDELFDRIRRAARVWVEHNFDALSNTATLLRNFDGI